MEPIKSFFFYTHWKYNSPEDVAQVEAGDLVLFDERGEEEHTSYLIIDVDRNNPFGFTDCLGHTIYFLDPEGYIAAWTIA